MAQGSGRGVCRTLQASHGPRQCTMTALRMLRRGDIKGRQVCPGAPWVIKAADLVGFRGKTPTKPPLTPNTSQQAFDFQ